MNHVVESRLRDHIFTPRTHAGNPLVAGLGTLAGGTLGFIAGNLPGAVAGGKVGHDLGHMVTRKRPPPVPEEGEAPPKKRSWLKKAWDNGGKHLAMAAGAAAGTYALGKGAQYLDQRSGGQYSAAIGRAADSGREAIGRLRQGGTAERPNPPPRPPPRYPATAYHREGHGGHVPPAAEPDEHDTGRTYRRARQGQVPLPPSPTTRRGQPTGRLPWDVPEADIQMEEMDVDLPRTRPRGRSVRDGPSTTLWEAPNVEDEANVGPSGIDRRRAARHRHALPPDGAVHRQPTTRSRVEVGTQLYDFDEQVESTAPIRTRGRGRAPPIRDTDNSRGTQYDGHLSYGLDR